MSDGCDYSNGSRSSGSIKANPCGTDIVTWVENMVVKKHYIDSHIPESCATEECQNNQQVDLTIGIKVIQVDLD